METTSATGQGEIPAVISEHIEITPGVCGGRPRVRGHRIKVQHIAVWHERMGLSPDEILSQHPGLTLGDVHAALAYYWDHRRRSTPISRRTEISRKPYVATLPTFSKRLGSGMPQTIRFHLDEHCPTAVVDGLRRRGIDVVTTVEANLRSAKDEAHLAYWFAQGRVLFTQDEDFLRLHAAGSPHAGIAYCHQETRSVGEIIRGLQLIWEVYDPEEMAGRIEYL